MRSPRPHWRHLCRRTCRRDGRRVRLAGSWCCGVDLGCVDCGVEKWQDVGGQDACKDTAKCGAEEWESDPYTTTVDRTCLPWGDCNFPAAPHMAGEYVTQVPDGYRPRLCANLRGHLL